MGTVYQIGVLPGKGFKVLQAATMGNLHRSAREALVGDYIVCLEVAGVRCEMIPEGNEEGAALVSLVLGPGLNRCIGS